MANNKKPKNDVSIFWGQLRANDVPLGDIEKYVTEGLTTILKGMDAEDSAVNSVIKRENVRLYIVEKLADKVPPDQRAAMMPMMNKVIDQLPEAMHVNYDAVPGVVQAALRAADVDKNGILSDKELAGIKAEQWVLDASKIIPEIPGILATFKNMQGGEERGLPSASSPVASLKKDASTVVVRE